MRYRYGLLGFLSLIGVVGLIIEEPAFYPFFAFVLFFEYFFIKLGLLCQSFGYDCGRLLSGPFRANSRTCAAPGNWLGLCMFPDCLFLHCNLF